jgi:hypothetical protein
MNKLGTVKFSGLSGHRYEFAAYPLDTVFDEAFSGVFVVTRRRQGKSKRGFTHKRICAGLSDKLRQLLTSEEQSLSAQGANCVCLHSENDEGAMQKIEQDLLRKPPAANA